MRTLLLLLSLFIPLRCLHTGHDGELPFVRIGSQRIVYRREDIEEFIAHRVVRKGVGDAA
jgi:hypothetical protein